MKPGERAVGAYIGQLSNLVRRRLQIFPANGCLSGAQGKALHFILVHNKCEGEVFQKNLEEEYGLRPSTASALLKKMEEDGLITRVAMDYDARLKKIIPTEKALQFEDQVISSIYQLEMDLERGISNEELDIFCRVMQKMMENLS